MKSYQKLYEYDFFGYTIGLYINGNTKEGTLFGLITTLIYILTFIGVTIYYITEIFFRKNYTFSTSTMKLEKAVSIQLDKDVFALNFALQNPVTYADYIDETIYYIKANLITGIRNSTTQKFLWYYEEIKTGPCSLDMFSENYHQFYKDGYNNKYCLYDIDKKNLTGHFNFDYYSQIVISFYPCVNNTENNNHCKSKNIIDYYLNSTYVGMFLKSITIDEKQIPMTIDYLENPFTTVGQDFFRDYQVLLKIVETEDDDNIIYTSKKFKKLLQFDYTREMFTLNRKVYDDSFCDVTIKLSDKKTVYKKSYEKLSNALYKVGGIMPVIYYIIKIILWFPVKTVYEINAINNVFKFNMRKSIKKISKKNIQKTMYNFNSNTRILKKEIKKNNTNTLKILNRLKNKNDEDIKDNSKNVSNTELLYSKKINDINLKFQKTKNTICDSSTNINHKKVQNNNFDSIINQKELNNNIFNNFRENIEREINKKSIIKQEDNKYIVKMIKINWYQFLCYYPLKQYSNNIKIILAENGRKFYMQNLDIINIFKNTVMIKKLIDHMIINKMILGLSDNKNISYYDKPIISENKCNYN